MVLYPVPTISSGGAEMVVGTFVLGLNDDAGAKHPQTLYRVVGTLVPQMYRT